MQAMGTSHYYEIIEVENETYRKAQATNFLVSKEAWSE